jgi:AraC-like DNA-binding protein
MPWRRSPIGNRRHKRYVTRVRNMDENRHGPGMRQQLTDQVEKYLKSLNNKDNIAEQLKRRLAHLLARGEANADYACRAMKLSRRTLQRRLKAEKTSFQKVLKEVRAELAVRYLSDRRLKALEVAMLLGYNNFSSFTTAFKSWYDMPPAEYRQKFLAF